MARQWACILRSKGFKSAHVWAKEATFENWPEGWHLTGGEVRVMYLRAPASTDEWSHIGVLAKPGVAVLEEQFSPAPGTVLAALQLLAVGDSKIVHDEVFYDRSPGKAKPVKRWPAAPGPADTTTRTKKTTATFSRAMAASDVTTMQRLLARDMLFYDTTQKQGYRGSAQFAKWWKSLMPVSFDDMRTVPLIVGDGWAVARWTATGADASTSGTIMPGATVYEVRDGRIVRLTLYYDSATLPLQD